MRVNDLIFKELLKRGYKAEGDKRVWDVADSKLWYINPEQARGFLDLSYAEEYRKAITEKEMELIKEHMEDFIATLPLSSFNIIDLGCGDGKKASLLITELAKKATIRYCPIDISAYMVSLAADTVRELNIGEVLEFKWNISDFENLNNVTPLFRDPKFEVHFMLLLGNTLGNFERDEMLHGIKESMAENDVLLIGNGLTDGHEDWINEYKDEKINEWLIHIPKHLGLSEEDVEYDVRYVNSRVEELYILKNDKKITHLGKTVEFIKGDILISAISYKYTKPEFAKVLQEFFGQVEIYSDKQETYALALCKK